MTAEPVAAIRGRVVWRGAADYASTRSAMLWNGWKPDRWPEVIVRAVDEADVVAAVRYAAGRGLRVAVRGGGHSWCGSPVRDGGMLLDVSGLRSVTIDPAARTASISPGVSNRELAAALGEHGLAFPVGHCGQVPASGYLLSGGLGWNSGVLGPACRRVRAVRVVTAAGEVVRADAHENPELLWAARGAGPGFFGVVTCFEIDLYPLPGAMTAGSEVYALTDLEQVAQRMTELEASLPPAVELTLLLAPPPPDVPPQPEGRVAILAATAFVDTPGDAAVALAPFDRRPPARALSRQVGTPTSFEALYAVSAGLWPEGRRFAADTAWTDAGPGDLLPRLRDAVLAAPAPESLVLVTVAPLPVPDPASAAGMAFSMSARMLIDCYAVWPDEGGDRANREWLRHTMAALAPVTVGHYIAEADLGADATRAARSFAPADWRRLDRLRARADPTGRFHTYLTPD